MKCKKIIYLLLVLSFFLISCSSKSNKQPESNDQDTTINDGIYVSINGTSTNLGTMDSPYDIYTGFVKADRQKPLYVMGGIYYMSKTIQLSKIGTNENPIKIMAYNNQDVILEYGKEYNSSLPITNTYSKTAEYGIYIKGSYYHLKGFEVRGAGSTGIRISGNYNIVENCVTAFNGNTGLRISSVSTEGNLSTWSHDNLVKNCTSFANFDWNRSDGNQGEDADGFSSNLTSGYNNVFDGCMSYNNSDDGWDLFTKQATGPIGSVTIKNCIAFRNGIYVDGTDMKNGNGFKLGGRAIEVDHYVENCIAFENKANGFDDNSNPGCITLKDCTAYANKARNFAVGRFINETNTYNATWYENDVLYGPIENVPMSHNNLYNCLSYKGEGMDNYCGVVKNSLMWRNEKFMRIDNLSNCINNGAEMLSYNPFESTEFIYTDYNNYHKYLRNDDGSINLGKFLKTNNMGANLH